MKQLTVSTARPYESHIQSGLLSLTGQMLAALRPPQAHTKVALVTDDVVAALYADRVQNSLQQAGYTVVRFVFAHGEASKSHEVLCELYNFLTEHQMTRTDLIAALGGGVVGDLAGYAAATYLRGISYVQLPTTLLAAVDSSVGGKTAVNLPGGKNLVGAFWQPIAVLTDPDALATLPDEIFADGMAEVIKYGCIADAQLFALLGNSTAHTLPLEEVIYRCVKVKRDLVVADEKDTGLRQLLNFGHTIGHAIEKHSQLQMTHGQAVAAGMCLITRASEQNGLTTPGQAQRIARLAEQYRLLTGYNAPIAALLPYLTADKKRSGDHLNLVVLEEIGSAKLCPIAIQQLSGWMKGAWA